MKLDDPDNADRSYAFNKAVFETEILPVYKARGFHPNTLVQIPLILPFELPFPNGCVTIVPDEPDTMISYHFADYQFERLLTAGLIDHEPFRIPLVQTRVEMMYALLESTAIEESLTAAFDLLLCNLNYIVLGYLTGKKDPAVYRITKEMLDPALLVRVVGVPDWSTKQLLFMTHTELPYKREPLTRESLFEVLRYANMLRKELNPFIVSEEFMLGAVRYKNAGFFREAVVWAQIAMEVFLGVLHAKLLAHEGATPAEASRLSMNRSFIRMVRTEFHGRIGGHWDVTKVDTPVGRWYTRTYEIRNRAVHSGYTPTRSEADEAIQAAMDLRQEVTRLLLAKRDVYPGVADFFILPPVV